MRAYVLRIRSLTNYSLALDAGVFSVVGADVTLDVEAPELGTIADLSATAGVESVVLSWTAAANATSHQPQYSSNGGSDWSDFGSALGGSATGVTVTGLTADVEYTFRVIASDGSTQTISNTDTATPTEANTDHPNEPVGFTAETERTFSAEDEDDWTVADDNNRFSIGTDANAPMSPSSVGVVTYEQGYSGGGGTPCRIQRVFSSSRDVYFHFAVKFSENWQGHTASVNKILYLTAGGTGGGGDPMFFVARGSGTGTLRFEPRVQGSPDGTFNLEYNGSGNGVSPSVGDVTFVRGEWREIEVYVRGNDSGQSNAEVHAWVDGVKTHEFTGMELLESGSQFDNIRWEPIWGGTGSTPVAEEMSMSIDHFYCSLPS